MHTNILDTIIAHKKNEVAKVKAAVSAGDLERSKYFMREPLSLKQSLMRAGATGIIAEFKRKSPSKGILHANADVEMITRGYAEGGASGLSVLTDEYFFGGRNDDLEIARMHALPILRKDFVVDEYQVLEAKAIGADVILLIAACLLPQQVKTLAALAKTIGLEVLLEVHDAGELAHDCDAVDIIGVNNRDLKTFTVDIARSIQLINEIPAGKVPVSESGISDVNTIRQLKHHGYKGFLIGETFMKNNDPAIAFSKFVQHLKTLVI